MTSHQWFNARVAFWQGHPCPFCGHVGVPGSITILSTTSINCGECKAAVEGFELGNDDRGHVQVENHVLFDPLGSYPYRPHRKQA